jgi:hypothetical protein
VAGYDKESRPSYRTTSNLSFPELIHSHQTIGQSRVHVPTLREVASVPPHRAR